MKINKEKKSNKKFEVAKFEVAKLKNMRLIIGGKDDPIDTNHKGGGGSTANCEN